MTWQAVLVEVELETLHVVPYFLCIVVDLLKRLLVKVNEEVQLTL